MRTQKQKERAKLILVGILKDEKRYAAYQISGYGFAREKVLCRNAKEGIVPLDPCAWVGGLDSAGLQAMTRLYYELEKLDLVELIIDCCRLSHLRLTPKGREFAAILSRGGDVEL